MKRTKAQIDNLLDDIAQFTVLLSDSDYGINYKPKYLNFSSFERIIDENLRYWHYKKGAKAFTRSGKISEINLTALKNI